MNNGLIQLEPFTKYCLTGSDGLKSVQSSAHLTAGGAGPSKQDADGEDANSNLATPQTGIQRFIAPPFVAWPLLEFRFDWVRLLGEATKGTGTGTGYLACLLTLALD